MPEGDTVFALARRLDTALRDRVAADVVSQRGIGDVRRACSLQRLGANDMAEILA